MPKPHRYIRDRLAGVAEEAAAYLRRRRVSRRPFARVYGPGGVPRAVSASEDRADELFAAAAALLEAERGERA